MAFTDVAYRKRKKGARKIDRNREDCEQIVSKKKRKVCARRGSDGIDHPNFSKSMRLTSRTSVLYINMNIINIYIKI